MRRGAPFVAVGLVAVMLGLATSTSTSERVALAAAAVSMCVVALAAVVIPWRRLPDWCQGVLPLAFYLVVGLLRHARGGAEAGYPPLVMLPLIWMAMYGTRSQLRQAIAGMAVTLIAPLVIIGPPLYPASAWSVAVLSVAIGMLAAPMVQRLVDESRQRSTDVAALGTITRALTAGADPRPELCRAAQLVTGASFAVLFEEGDDGMLTATAGTRGLDLAQMSIDPHAETSGTGEAWRTGRRVYFVDSSTDARASTRMTALTGSLAVLFQPVTRAGRTMAVLVVGFTETRSKFPDGTLYMVELVAAEVAAALGRADLVALLASQARTDAMTGAANRRSWDEELDRELDRARTTGLPLTVALIDMDRFKTYNDTHGHTAGDALLRELVTALRRELRAGDVIARWGGEEFALALPGRDLEEARAITTRMLRVVPGGQTVSIGLALAGELDTPRSVIGRADRALYAAKDGGRDRVEAAPTWSAPPSDRGTPDADPLIRR